MSTKTTFKRVALVAVAALGLGVLSVAPSSATVTGLTVTVADGTAKIAGAATDSTTAATVNVQGILNQNDSVTVTLVEVAKPAGSTPIVSLANADSATPTMAASQIKVDTQTTVSAAAGAGTGWAVKETATSGTARISQAGTGGIFFNQNFNVYLETPTSTRKAGTYTWTVIVKSYDSSSTVPTSVIAKNVSIVIAAAASASTTPSAVNSFAQLNSSANVTTLGNDVAISAVATAGSTVGYLHVGVRNADGTLTNVALDSVTATITGAGLLSNGGISGSSIKLAATGDVEFGILSDGRAGVATISVVTNVASYTKTVTFYAAAAKTFTTTVAPSTLVIGANDSAVAVTAVDANGTNWAGQAYIVASSAADALIAGSTTPVACVYNSTSKVHWCPVTTLLAGTAKFKVIDASTVALATATSTEFSVTASAEKAAKISLSFDKASYQPYEKAYIKVAVLDAAGNRLGAKTYTNAVATGGITTNIAFSGTVPTLTGTDVTIAALDGVDTFGGYLTYVVYMPATGDVTITAKGGTSLPVAGQVAVTATASVVNSSVDAATDAANEATDAANAATDAALAAADAADAATAAAQDASDAVAALSATVAKLVASLKAQITSLTNLVIKIQKKVRA